MNRILAALKQTAINRAIVIGRLTLSPAIFSTFFPLELRWYLHRLTSSWKRRSFVVEINTKKLPGFSLKKKLKIILPKGSLGTLEEIFIDREYDIPLPTSVPVILDIGANIGLYSLFAWCKYGSKSKIYALEPVTSNFEILGLNTRANDVKCQLFQKGAYFKQTKMNIYLHGTATHSLYAPSNKTETIQLTTIDQITKSNKLTNIDILKLDVEGAELAVLQGAEKTLARTSNVLVEASGEEFKRIHARLSKHHFILVKSIKSQVHHYQRQHS